MKRSAEVQGKAAYLKIPATALTSRWSVRGGTKAGGAPELQGMGDPGPGGAALGCGQPQMRKAPPNEERRPRQDVLGVPLAWLPSEDLASSQLSSIPPVTQPRNFL